MISGECSFGFVSKSVKALNGSTKDVKKFCTGVSQCGTVAVSGVETQHLNVDAEKPLCKLVVDWLETAMQDQPVDELSENVIHLQCAVTSNQCGWQNSVNCLVYCVT